MAQKKHRLSGEHFSVDGTLIEAWAGHKSFVAKDDSARGTLGTRLIGRYFSSLPARDPSQHSWRRVPRDRTTAKLASS